MKKAFREKEGYKDIFINDDLTPLRAKLLAMVKMVDGIDRASTMDGRIFCTKKQTLERDVQQKPIVIETPDDLFRIGVDSIDYDLLGLSHLAEVQY